MIDGAVLHNILGFGPVFLLLAVRAYAMMQVAPIFSSGAIPPVAKIALAGLAAFAVMPTAEVFFAEDSLTGVPGVGIVTLPGGAVTDLRYAPFSFTFLLLIVGEGIIGIIIGFFMMIIFATFASAGQFFSLQMGFAASAAFDPLAQVENPLMGQFLNLVAMLVFLTIGGFQQLFLGGFWRSVQTINIISLIEGAEPVITMIVSGLPRLFLDAIVISMPILGTLFLTSLATGLISKAAPQINILSEGFPISITVAFIIVMASLPFMTEAFSRVINSGFSTLESLYIQIGRQITGGDGF